MYVPKVDQETAKGFFTPFPEGTELFADIDNGDHLSRIERDNNGNLVVVDIEAKTTASGSEIERYKVSVSSATFAAIGTAPQRISDLNTEVPDSFLPVNAFLKKTDGNGAASTPKPVIYSGTEPTYGVMASVMEGASANFSAGNGEIRQFAQNFGITNGVKSNDDGVIPGDANSVLVLGTNSGEDPAGAPSIDLYIDGYDLQS